MLRINSSSLSAAAFQHAACHSNQHISRRTWHPVGAGISIRPFARSQRRFRHHCEVNVPGLHLRFHTEDFCESVRFPALPLRSVSRPNRGDVNARNPFSAPAFNTPNSSPISTPLQAFFRKPSGSKRSTGSKPGSSSHQTSDCPLLPAASSCDSASDQCSKLAPSELDLSFRKPWNCLDHSQRTTRGQTKNDRFVTLSTEFIDLQNQ